ncbi:MAG: recombinase family protein [Dehalococcoidia bacterium]
MNFAFDSYLASGSIKLTMQALNSRGYRTKSYTSRRERHHPGSAFTTSSTQYLLKNPAYIAKKEINKSAKVRGKREYKMVDAICRPSSMSQVRGRPAPDEVKWQVEPQRGFTDAPHVRAEPGTPALWPLPYCDGGAERHGTGRRQVLLLRLPPRRMLVESHGTGSRRRRPRAAARTGIRRWAAGCDRRADESAPGKGIAFP